MQRGCATGLPPAAHNGAPSCPPVPSEVRRERQAKAVEHTDQLAGQMKRAADALVTHPFRVWDIASAQRVKGCGPAMARVCKMCRE